MSAEFLARMERLLWLYQQPYDPRFPVVCFDERSCFLIGDTVAAQAMQSGKVRREHYAFEKLGSCALLAAIEPLTGKRVAQNFERRRKREYALFLRKVAEEFSDAEKIGLVQDNLNTHTAGAFYETFAADEAFALTQKIEFYYTPKSASWLNMIEIEFSAIVKQCLNRRIVSRLELEREVLAIVKEREEKAIKIDWQFSLEAARRKLDKHYEQVLAENLKPEQT
jgi:hypothetical protein